MATAGVPLAGSAEEKAMLEREANKWKDNFHCHEGNLNNVFKMGVVSLKEYLRKFGCPGDVYNVSFETLPLHCDPITEQRKNNTFDFLPTEEELEGKTKEELLDRVAPKYLAVAQAHTVVEAADTGKANWNKKREATMTQEEFLQNANQSVVDAMNAEPGPEKLRNISLAKQAVRDAMEKLERLKFEESMALTEYQFAAHPLINQLKEVKNKTHPPDQREGSP